MKISEEVLAIEKLYAEIDKKNNLFLSHANICCPEGCAKCCHGKHVEMSPVEFLPYSYHLYQEHTLADKYWYFKSHPNDACFLVEGDSQGIHGRCSEYSYRGITCRLFGCGSFLKKNDVKSFSGCHALKERIVDPIDFQKQLQKWSLVYSDCYMQLRAIDNVNGVLIMPVNTAILQSMEMVYNHTPHYQRV